MRLNDSVSHAIPWGRSADGYQVSRYLIGNPLLRAEISDLGAGIVSLRHKGENVVLSLPKAELYRSAPYFGSTIGRYAGRIAGGKFSLAGTGYELPLNDQAETHPCCLHGGEEGFDKQIWEVVRHDENSIELRYLSLDGEEGFPGTLLVGVRYVIDGETLRIEYVASTDEATPINLTNHSYFNLSGGSEEDILGHELTIPAAHMLEIDEGLIPTGKLLSTTDTAFDFQSPALIGIRIEEIKGPLPGYDHSFALEGDGQFIHAATLRHEASGRTMECWTTEPSIHLYTGGFLDGTLTSSEGKKLDRFAGVCLETQHYPNSPNEPSFPTCILQPDEEFFSVTEYRFSG